jgi:hypothetical protein
VGLRVACLADWRFTYLVVIGKPEENRPPVNLIVDGKIIVKGNLHEI